MNFGKVISTENLAIFTRQLATLLQAGLPLLRSMEVMIRQEKNLRFKAVLTSLADNVRSGNNLSDGLQQHPKVFDRLFVNMVKAGEAGGVLDVVLSRLARFMEKTVKTNKKIKAALIYPSVVITVAFLHRHAADGVRGAALPGHFPGHAQGREAAVAHPAGH